MILHEPDSLFSFENIPLPSYAGAKIARETSLRVYELPEGERPRDRLFYAGPEALSLTELLAVLLNTGSGHQGLSAADIAQHLATQFDRRALQHISAEQLMQISGIGPAKAATIVAALELGKRVWTPHINFGEVIDDPEKAMMAVLPVLSHLQVEKMAVLHLDIKHRLINTRVISQGTIEETYAVPRDIFREAVAQAVPRIIVAHNHPSGDPTPSCDDIALTKTLVDAGKVIGITVLDHVVIGAGSFRSIHQDNPSLFRDAS